MAKIMKILGKRGRITIPYEIRQKLGFRYNDILSFEDNGNDTVTVRREKICTDCKSTSVSPFSKPENEETLLDFLDSLTKSEQRAALVHLSVHFAEQKDFR